VPHAVDVHAQGEVKPRRGGFVVGSGYIFSGHNDSSPANSLAAAVDGDPYNTTGQSSPSNQKLTLTLNNGEVIWDMAGNVWEWINATIAAGQQPGLIGDSSYAWKQWSDVQLLMNGLPVASQPGSTGLPGVAWSSSAGVGQLRSNYNEAMITRAFPRGGSWTDGGGHAGVLALALNGDPTYTNTNVGFRVSR
jgi:formylglycine-generating enzyme required for sulfatase activity